MYSIRFVLNRAYRTLAAAGFVAFSSLASANTYYVSTSGNDGNSGSQGSPLRTITQAILIAANGDDIHVAPGIYTERPDVDRSVSIIGDGAGLVRIDGTSSGRALFIEPNATVTLRNIEITRGAAVRGAGIYVGGTLIAENCTIASNVASTGSPARSGGGVYNAGTATLRNCTIAGNVVSGQADPVLNAFGAGIFNNVGRTLNIESCTIMNNTAQSGVWASRGGGIYNSDTGVVSIRNSIVANNVAASAGPDLFFTINSQGHNLFRQTIGATISGDTTGNLSLDPLLDGLADNGGNTRTFATQTGSPCIDAADPVNFPAADQRGLPRGGDGDGNGVARADIGAYERQPMLLRGDMNCDGSVNNFDIDPFVIALIFPETWAATYPNCSPLVGDVDNNGRFDNFDIDPFVALLVQ